MTLLQHSWRRFAAALAAGALLAMAGCSTPPAYQVSEQPAARIGTVDSIQQEAVQNVPNAVGAIDARLPSMTRNEAVVALMGLVVNIISDFAYTLVDPRIDFESREV